GRGRRRVGLRDGHRARRRDLLRAGRRLPGGRLRLRLRLRARGVRTLRAQAGSSSGWTTTPPKRASWARCSTPPIHTRPARTSGEAGDPSSAWWAVYPPRRLAFESETARPSASVTSSAHHVHTCRG